ncbi:hypothetical protein HPB48_027056 [Haemaphysalis longicornis]|uniref:Uncharacterized protein n=1 Tax=Haemaphysalis longicornis TaxID=44386 RepID=A0A9J6HCB2_HAELO|nr:hypothetical protein HPB48_027056 [Haemaphysalis longicornis]
MYRAQNDRGGGNGTNANPSLDEVQTAEPIGLLDYTKPARREALSDRCTTCHPRTSNRRGWSSNAAVQFLKRQGQSNQGISLQELNSGLSCVLPRRRTKCGNPADSLKEFLRQFPRVLVVGKQGKVFVRRRNRRATSTLNGTGFMAATSYSCTDEDDVTCLTDVTGKVHCIFSLYGFISVKYPLSTSAYFDLKVFENAQHRSLRS